jgi:glutamate formiminotransferase / 5-formyltetrahydrofolate cyclo-ligase
MEQFVECVPNFSEGRRVEVVTGLRQAIEGSPRVRLLDQTADADHNRSVITFAGAPGPVSDAMEQAVAVAIETIDMNVHQGEHPRMGAVDVIPFVPIGATTLEECVELARAFGKRIAERFALPVYLYAGAASRPERVRLPDVRKPQYEGLRDLIGRPGWEPDFGPPRLHPTAGAVAVGARPFLIAYNVNLETTDSDLAKGIAKRIRESSGGLPKVQALGLWLEELRCAQVSMNLLDFTVTPLWRVFEEVERLAAAEGVAVRESELIGLSPLAALLDVADHAGVARDLPVEERLRGGAGWLKLRDFDPGMALELRLGLGQEGASRS